MDEVELERVLAGCRRAEHLDRDEHALSRLNGGAETGAQPFCGSLDPAVRDPDLRVGLQAAGPALAAEVLDLDVERACLAGCDAEVLVQQARAR